MVSDGGSDGTTLTPKQESILCEWGRKYQAHSKTADGIGDKRMRMQRRDCLNELLSENSLESMGEGDLIEMCCKMWAFKRFWGSKQILRNMILKPNGIRNIRNGLRELLYGEGEINKRFDKFQSTKGFAASSISEILNFVFPSEYFLWNSTIKGVLTKIDASILPDGIVEHGVRTGMEYVEYVQAMVPVRKALEAHGVHDFVDLGAVFWYMQKEINSKRERSKRGRKRPAEDFRNEHSLDVVQISTHQAAQYHLLSLGRRMGYKTYTPDRTKKHNERNLGEEATLVKMPKFTGEHGIEDAEQVDVIWFDKYNKPVACFEVEHTTRVRTGLNRFVSLDHHKIKFFIVAKENERSRFAKMMMKDPYNAMDNPVKFLSYDELVEVVRSALPFHDLRDKYLWDPKTQQRS